MFEHHSKPLISRRAFAKRIFLWFSITCTLTALSLIAGIYGYHHYEDMSLIDATLNAAMILGGMGPVDTLHTDSGKIFASLYALYSGLFLVICGGLLLAPVFHRVLHIFHEKD